LFEAKNNTITFIDIKTGPSDWRDLFFYAGSRNDINPDSSLLPDHLIYISAGDNKS
jgi:hypothetical protein